MNEFDVPAHQAPATDSPPRTDAGAGTPPVTDTPAAVDPAEFAPRSVDPVRAAAGRLGGRRVHRLAQLGREYEREHGLAPGRQRLKQLVQLGRRYEQEHGLAAPRPRRRSRGDAWQEFLTALARVVKPTHRPAVERLAAALQGGAEETTAA
jgi:hypothetical protein